LGVFGHFWDVIFHEISLKFSVFFLGKVGEKVGKKWGKSGQKSGGKSGPKMTPKMG